MQTLFIRSLNGLVAVPALVVGLDTKAGRAAMVSWQRDIQEPFVDSRQHVDIDGQRADYKWNWRRNHSWLNTFVRSGLQRPFGFAVVARSLSNKPVTVALAHGIQPFPCINHESVRHHPKDGFLWYITGIPPSAADHLGLPGLRATAFTVRLCSDLCEQMLSGAKMVLHADPKGGNVLLQFYGVKCNMHNLSKDVGIRAPFPRTNDGRYFRTHAFP